MTDLTELAHLALAARFSPRKVERFKEVLRMGVSIGTVARAVKVLQAYGTTPENDHEWSVFMETKDEPVPLQLWHKATGTWIEVLWLPQEVDRE